MAAKTKKRDLKQEELDNLWQNRRFRFRQLLGDDWPEDDIESLAKGDKHPTELENLLKQGCPPRTAVRICLPLI